MGDSTVYDSSELIIVVPLFFGYAEYYTSSDQIFKTVLGFQTDFKKGEEARLSLGYVLSFFGIYLDPN
jgi:hypothetical protein